MFAVHWIPGAGKPQPNHWLEPRKARKVRKINILESTEYTEQTECLAAGLSFRWRIRLNKMNSECWKRQRLRRLGGCHRFARCKGCHAKVHSHGENLCEKNKKMNDSSTEETECLADVGHSAEEVIDRKWILRKEESERHPSARRFPCATRGNFFAKNTK